MIVVRLFASLRETLGSGEVCLDSADISSVADVINVLANRGDHWQEALAAKNLLVAVNQHHVDKSAPVVAGDEVAIFPPVTGG